MARPKKPRIDKPFALRIPPYLLSQVKETAELMQKSDQEIIRLATEIGLEHLRRIDYNLAKAVVDAAEGKPEECKNHKIA